MELSIHVTLKEKMEKTLSVLQADLNTVRAGRANPSILDKLTIDYYGSLTPLKQVANISAPEPRMLTIQPFDPTTIKAIEKSILQSDVGINPSNDGKMIRLVVPQLTEERRKELIKVIKKMGEGSKVALRNERRHSNEALKKMEKDSDLTEDDLKAALDEVQTIIEDYGKKVDGMIADKDKELMEV